MTSTGGPAGRTDDIAALRDLFARMVAAWDHADAAAYGDVFTEDADYIGRHRAPRALRFAVRKLFYVARHARR